MAPTGSIVLSTFGTGQRGVGVGDDGRRMLQQPRGVHVGADNALIVADFGNHCVVRFPLGTAGSKGKVVAGEEGKSLPTVDPLKDIDRPLGPPEGEGTLLKRPVDICDDGDGGLLVLDSEECRIQRFEMSKAGGAAQTVVPPPNAPPQKSVHAPESIKYPRAFLRCEDGALVVCDTWSHCVRRFAAPNGPDAGERPVVLAGRPNSNGCSEDQLAFPSGIAFDEVGNLFVADTGNHRVQRFAPGETRGTTVAGSSAGQPGASFEELNMPTGLCCHPSDGSLFVADRANARVLRFPASSCAGSLGEVVAGPDIVLSPWGLCFDTDGFIYVSDERRAVVLKLELFSAPLSCEREVAEQSGASPENSAEACSGEGSGEVPNELD